MAHLELTNITKTFGTFEALRGMSLSVEQGEFVSFLGGSGCGKTTTLRIIAGFEEATSGEVFLGGKSLLGVPPEKRNLGFVFQHYALFPNMTVGGNVAFGLKGLNLDRRSLNGRVDEYLSLVKMEDFAHRFPGELSGGQQQRVALARALARRPDVLLLDEPLSALDAKIRAHLRTELRAIQKKLGITAVYVTHDQEEALSLSDRIVLMRDGQIEQIGEPRDLYDRPATEFASSFIGIMNRIPAKLRDPETGAVSVGGRTTVLGKAVSGQAGGDITLAVRPERVFLERRSPDDIMIPGIVKDQRFLGSVCRMDVDVGGQSGAYQVLVDRFNTGTTDQAVGNEPVALFIRPEDCAVY